MARTMQSFCRGHPARQLFRSAKTLGLVAGRWFRATSLTWKSIWRAAADAHHGRITLTEAGAKHFEFCQR